MHTSTQLCRDSTCDFFLRIQFEIKKMSNWPHNKSRGTHVVFYDLVQARNVAKNLNLAIMFNVIELLLYVKVLNELPKYYPYALPSSLSWNDSCRIVRFNPGYSTT